MKKLLLSVFLVSSLATSQVYQTFSMHFVRVEGDLEAVRRFDVDFYVRRRRRFEPWCALHARRRAEGL